MEIRVPSLALTTLATPSPPPTLPRNGIENEQNQSTEPSNETHNPHATTSSTTAKARRLSANTWQEATATNNADTSNNNSNASTVAAPAPYIREDRKKAQRSVSSPRINSVYKKDLPPAPPESATPAPTHTHFHPQTVGNDDEEEGFEENEDKVPL